MTPAATAPMRLQRKFAMTHASEVSAARRHGQLLAEQVGIGPNQAGKLAIAITEAGTNILKHGSDGWLVISAARHNGCDGVEVMALDRGKGIANISQSLRDGVSTTGTAGTGLGAMRRLSDIFDLYSTPTLGTAVFLFIGDATGFDGRLDGIRSAAPQRLQIGAVCLPIAGEEECGDDWEVVQDEQSATILVVDGLGHGPGAAQAAHAAVAHLRMESGKTPLALVHSLHTALGATRGAAALIAQLRLEGDCLSFVGVGNIAARVIDGDQNQHLVSHNGIVGHNLRKVQSLSVRWPVGACCVVCSDGIATQWDIANYPGLLACHATLIAGVLYRDFLRLRDDATVLVLKRLS